MIKKCPTCNNEFIAKKRIAIYCSRKCSGTSKKKKIIKKCLICNKQITTIPSQIIRKKYCSKKCRNLSKKGKTPWNKIEKVKKYCINCHKEIFMIKSLAKRKKFCSMECIRNYGKIETVCEICEKKFYTIKSRKNTVRFCSKKCDSVWRSQLLGEKAVRWDGGIKKILGYILIYIPKHPFASKQKYVREHRLIVEKQIGRYLTPKETVHYLNKIKDDNRPKNLMAFTSNSAHHRFHNNPNNVKPSEIIFDGRLIK